MLLTLYRLEKLNFIQIFSSYRAANVLPLGYKKELLNAVLEYNDLFYGEQNKTRTDSVDRAYILGC